MLQDNKYGLELVKEWIRQKLQNQKDFQEPVNESKR